MDGVMTGNYNYNYMKKHTSGKAIVFLQDSLSVQKVEKLFEYQWRGKVLFSHGTSSSRGVCICFRYDLDYKTFEVINDKDGRYIIATSEIQGQPYVLINCYAPNSETGQIKIFKDISKQLADMDIPKIINISVQKTGMLSLMPRWTRLERKKYLNVKQFFKLKLSCRILNW